jgi:hypothetical protein
VNINQAFPGSYLKAADLDGKRTTVTIKGVDMEDIGGDHKPVLKFVGKDKGVVLNKTNAGRLTELTGSADTDNWVGWSVQLVVEKVDYQGKRVQAIRINDDPSTAKRPGGKPIPVSDPEPVPPPITDDDIPF